MSVIAEQTSKWIRFEQHVQDPKRKTKTWSVFAKEGDNWLGNILWFGRWRTYAFQPPINQFTYFEKVCLRDIADFIEAANKEQCAMRKATKIDA